MNDDHLICTYSIPMQDNVCASVSMSVRCLKLMLTLMQVHIHCLLQAYIPVYNDSFFCVPKALIKEVIN